MPALAQRRLFLLLFSALIAAAWACLWVWERGPYARYLHAVEWADVGVLGALCVAVPGGSAVVSGALYAGAWLLMVAAMMLPTTLPLLQTFRRLTAQREDRDALLAHLLAGYFAVWATFGVLVHALDAGVHAAASRNGWLALHGWAVGAAILALAGLFQFSRLKYACLDRCRSPLTFVSEHWRGGNARRDSFRLGVYHGIFCVGCCWSLMVVMFVVGTASIGWMLGLAALMALEKNLPAGRFVARPLGVALLLWSLLIVVAESHWLPVGA
jgi:predicted metal-binding membrane protein